MGIHEVFVAGFTLAICVGILIVVEYIIWRRKQ